MNPFQPIGRALLELLALIGRVVLFLRDALLQGLTPKFYGRQIFRPAEYATLDQPMYDLEKDVVRGRKSMEDFDAAVTTWRSSGGDRMREYYESVRQQLDA